MDPTAAVNLGLIALKGLLDLINEIRGQGGVSDDTIAAQVATITAGNDAAYQQIMASLNLSATK